MPITNFGQVFPVLADIFPVHDQLVPKLLLQRGTLAAGLRQTVDRVHDEMKAVQVVQHRHVKGRRDSAFLLVAADMDVAVVGSAVGQLVNQRRIGMEGEDNWLVSGEQHVEFDIA